MMDTDEKILWSIACVVVTFIIVVLGCVIFMPKTFNGYYLCRGQIYASHEWEPDTRAFDYTPEMWKYIIENNLHLEKDK